MWLLVLTFLFSPLVNADNYADELSEDTFLSDDYLLIVDIFYGKYRLVDNVFIYTAPEANLVPLQPFVDALEFPIEVDPFTMQAKGWFIDENSLFELDVRKREVRVKGVVIPIPVNAIILEDGMDLYVDLQLLSEWFSINAELNKGKLRIKVDVIDGFPLDKRLAREVNREIMLLSRRYADTPIIKDHYNWIASPMPMIDLSTKYNVRTGGGSGSDSSSVPSVSLRASGDLLGMAGYFSISKSAEFESRKFFNLRKRPNSPEDTMFLGLSDVQIGDVNSVADNLTSTGGRGLGFDLQFGKFSNSSTFGKKMIEGDGPPGWEVELFRNGTLIEFSAVDADGQYKFEDITVEYGENIFDVRLYGPHGEERSIRSNLRIGRQMLPRGESFTRVNVVNAGERVFPLGSSNDFGSIEGLNEEPTESALTTFLQYQLGINDWLAMAVTLNEHKYAPNNEIDYAYKQIEVFGSFANFALAMNLADSDEGEAIAFSGQTSLKDIPITFQHKTYNDFISDRNENGQISDETLLRFNGQLKIANRGLNYGVSPELVRFGNGVSISSVATNVSFQVFSGGATISNRYVKSSIGNALSSGRLSYIRTLGWAASLRSGLDYEIKPKAKISSLSTRLGWQPVTSMVRLRAQVELRKQFGDTDGYAANFTGSYAYDRVTLSLAGTLQSEGNSGLLFTAAFSLIKDKDKPWSVSGSKRSQSARATVRVFLDQDGDSEFTDTDIPLEGVKFIGNRKWKDLSTDENGLLDLYGINISSRGQRVYLDPASLEDPFWKPKESAVQLYSHKGGTQLIDFPVLPTTEIEGDIFFLHKGRKAPLGGIPIYVKTADGAVIASAISEFDGFYYISGLMPGKYWLHIDDKVITKYKIEGYAARPFSTADGDGLVYIEPFILSPQ